MKWLLLVMGTALGPAIWGSTYIVTSELLPADKPFLAAFIRVFPAGLFLVLLGRCLPQAREWRRLLLLGFLNIGCFQAMLFIAAYRLPGGLAAVIGAVQPLLVVGLVSGSKRIAPNRMTLLGCIGGVLGMTLLILSPTLFTMNPIGIAAAFIGAISMSVGTYLSGKWHSDLPISAFTGWQLLLGSFMLLPVALWADLPLPEFTTTNILAYSYLSVFGTVVAYFLWFNGIRRLSSIAVSALGLLSPLSAAVLGWVLLDQRLTGLPLLGFAIVLSSVLMVQVSTSK